MKVALITDTHFGARSDSIAFDQYFKKFYDNIFFPELKKRKIDHVIHLGDVFDRRKYINYQTLKSCKEYFFSKLIAENITCYMMAGNHDTYYKNTNLVNSLDLLLHEYNNIHVLDTPQTVTLDVPIFVVPWICADNYKDTMDEMEKSPADICLGHLELSGFSMFKGQENHDGMDPSIFKKFKFVGSGHFHHKSSKSNVHYLGNPYHLFWGDYGDDRGFHVLDTKTLDLEFIKNTYTLFHKISYDDKENSMFHYDGYDVSELTGAQVKLIVVNKTDFAQFDRLVERIYKVNPLELKIIEDFSEFETEAIDETYEFEDTMTMLSSYVESIETDVDKEKLKGLLKTLYVEAQHSEEL